MSKKRKVFHEVCKSADEFEALCDAENPNWSEKLIVVDLHLDWCGPTQCMEAIYQTLFYSIDNPE